MRIHWTIIIMGLSRLSNRCDRREEREREREESRLLGSGGGETTNIPKYTLPVKINIAFFLNYMLLLLFCHNAFGGMRLCILCLLDRVLDLDHALERADQILHQQVRICCHTLGITTT